MNSDYNYDAGTSSSVARLNSGSSGTVPRIVRDDESEGSTPSFPTEFVDAKDAAPPVPIHELLGKIRKVDWLPRGRDRFSVKEILRSPAVVAGFVLISMASSIANPLHVDPYPYLHDFILGPKVVQSAPLSLPPNSLPEQKASLWLNQRQE